MKWFLLSFLLVPSVFACWRLTGAAEVRGQTVRIDQKMNHDQIYSFMAGTFILNMKIPSKGETAVVFDIKEKKNIELINVGQGKIPMKVGVPGEYETEGLTFTGTLRSI